MVKKNNKEDSFSFRHIGIVVSDIKKSVSFYKKFFNFIVEKKNLEKGIYLNSLIGTKDLTVKTVKLSDSSNQIRLELLDFKYYNKPNQTI